MLENGYPLVLCKICENNQRRKANIYTMTFKRATKLYCMHYSCMVIVLFNTALCMSAFSIVSFRKLVFRLSVLSLDQDIKIYGVYDCSNVVKLFEK